MTRQLIRDAQIVNGDGRTDLAVSSFGSTVTTTSLTAANRSGFFASRSPAIRLQTVRQISTMEGSATR